MEKQIKIIATMIDGTKQEFQTTKLQVCPIQDDSKRLYVELGTGFYTFFCKDIQIVS